MKIPFIVLDKEGNISQLNYDLEAEKIRRISPFICDHLIVWNQRQVDFWRKTGVDAKHITLGGNPRTDFFSHKERWRTKPQLGLPTDKKIILFFTYNAADCVHPYLKTDVNMDDWNDIRNDTHEVLLDLVKTRKDLFVVVKTHPQQSDLNTYLPENSTLPDNIVIKQGSYLAAHLMTHAALVIGYQTTALIEAMILERPVIYTHWGKVAELFGEQFIPFTTCKGLTTARNKAELKKQILSFLENDTIDQQTKSERAKFVGNYFYNPDGSTAERIIGIIETLVASAESDRRKFIQT